MADKIPIIEEAKKLEINRKKLKLKIEEKKKEFNQTPEGRLLAIYENQLQKNVTNKNKRSVVIIWLIKYQRTFRENIANMEKEIKLQNRIGRRDVLLALKKFEQWHPDELKYWMKIKNLIELNQLQSEHYDLRDTSDLKHFIENFDKFIEYMEKSRYMKKTAEDKRMTLTLMQISDRLKGYQFVNKFINKAYQTISYERSRGQWTHFRGKFQDELLAAVKEIRNRYTDKKLANELEQMHKKHIGEDIKKALAMMEKMKVKYSTPNGIKQLEHHHLALLKRACSINVTKFTKETEKARKRLETTVQRRIDMLKVDKKNAAIELIKTRDKVVVEEVKTLETLGSFKEKMEAELTETAKLKSQFDKLAIIYETEALMTEISQLPELPTPEQWDVIITKVNTHFPKLRATFHEAEDFRDKFSSIWERMKPIIQEGIGLWKKKKAEKPHEVNQVADIALEKAA